MKFKKMILTTVGIVLMLALNSVRSNAAVEHVVYNEVNLVISSIMKYTIPILIIAYVIFAIIYFEKSKKEKNNKIKKLTILFVINIIICIALYFGADMVLEAGKEYHNNRPLGPDPIKLY